MSLINDALKKARADADARAVQERASGGAAADYRPPRAHLPQRSGWAPGLVVGLAIGWLVATIVGVGWWLGLAPTAPTAATTAEPGDAPRVADVSIEAEPAMARPVEPEPAAEPMPTPATAAPQDRRPTEAQPSADPPQPDASVAAAEPTATTLPTVVEPTVEPAIEPAPEPEFDRPTEVAAVAEPLAVDAAPADPPSVEASRTTPRPALIQPPEQVGQVDDNVYVLEAQLGDLTLELDFIVWGATPFAQINGRQVEVDQAVDGGFLVDSIERLQVTLRHADGRSVVLRIR